MKIFDPSQTDRLFHGTCEVFDGLPRPGGYDGVFWTAEQSTIAQNYIPAAGASIITQQLSSFQMQESVRPAKNDPYYSVVNLMGFEAQDVTYDNLGRATSWKVPAGYPTYAQVCEFIENTLGYQSLQPYAKSYRLLSPDWDKETQTHRIAPANYKAIGQLLIVEGFQAMRFLDISTGDPDVSAVQYHNIKTFRQAQEQGYDGVVIDDFAQSKNWGNVGHRSIGFFEHAIERLHIERIPAANFDWKNTNAVQAFKEKETPEFSAWLSARKARECANRSERSLSPQ